MTMDEQLAHAEQEYKEASLALGDAQQRERLARCRLTDLRSQRFIAANHIRKADVHVSDGHDVPYFLMASEFAKWIAGQPSRKRWVEWSGTIYHTTDFLMGRLTGTDGRMADVPE